MWYEYVDRLSYVCHQGKAVLQLSMRFMGFDRFKSNFCFHLISITPAGTLLCQDEHVAQVLHLRPLEQS